MIKKIIIRKQIPPPSITLNTSVVEWNHMSALGKQTVGVILYWCFSIVSEIMTAGKGITIPEFMKNGHLSKHYIKLLLIMNINFASIYGIQCSQALSINEPMIVLCELLCSYTNYLNHCSWLNNSLVNVTVGVFLIANIYTSYFTFGTNISVYCKWISCVFLIT